MATGLAETMDKVAFLGTGLMGAPMARNLLSHGFDVTVWNRSPEKAAVLAADGATVAPSAKIAASAADIVVTMLSDGPAVADLLFEQGVADAMKQGSVVVDMSSIQPQQARSHHTRLAEFGIGHIDAPVSGGTKGAQAASLAIMAGGDSEVFERVRPALSAMGRPVLVGPAGSGQLAKLANQAIVAITIGAVSEALLLVREGGGDSRLFREALTGGFADSVILQQHGKRMEDGDFAPGGRSASQVKDLENVMQEAEALGLKLPLTALQRDRFAHLVGPIGGSDLDHSALFLQLLDENGMLPPSVR
jgi:2-hydroxy-3-oxopropionate reductase